MGEKKKRCTEDGGNWSGRGRGLSQCRQVALREPLIICAAATGSRRGQRSASWLTGASPIHQSELRMIKEGGGHLIVCYLHIIARYIILINSFVSVIEVLLKADTHTHSHAFQNKMNKRKNSTFSDFYFLSANFKEETWQIF